jgi:hypothetical protein
MHFSAATVAAAVLAVVPLLAKAQSVVYTVEDAPNGGNYANSISYVRLPLLPISYGTTDPDLCFPLPFYRGPSRTPPSLPARRPAPPIPVSTFPRWLECLFVD